MLLLPSEIHPSYSVLPQSSGEGPTSSVYSHPSNAQLPKLQVFKKAGQYFSLDNNCLRLYRELEKCRRCREIQVDVVPKTRIPKIVFDYTGKTPVNPGPADDDKSDLDTDETSSSDSEFDGESDNVEFDDLTCPVCAKRFDGIKALTEHKNAKKHFGCATCGQVFTSSKLLREHQQSTDHTSDNECDN